MLKMWSLKLVAVMLLAGLSQGCMVKAQDYRTLKDQNADLAAMAQGLQSEAANKRAENERLQAQYLSVSAALDEKNSELESMKLTGGAPPELAKIWKKLEELAGTRNDTMSWDTENHKLLVKVEFDLGSAAVKPTGKASLKDVASALKDLSSSYRIYVDGHTDNLPIVNPETLKKYPNNWALAAARAIAASGVLREFGVSSKLMINRSFGEYYPVGTNSTDQGRQRNRRVEISVVPANTAFTPTAMLKPESVTAQE